MVSPLLVYYLVHERDRNRSFPDGGGHALDAPRPHIADREYAGQTRFVEVRRAAMRPTRGGQLVLRQVTPRLDESLRVAHDAAIEPARVGIAAGHEEDVPDVVGLGFPGLIVPPAHAFEMVV